MWKVSLKLVFCRCFHTPALDIFIVKNRTKIRLFSETILIKLIRRVFTIFRKQNDRSIAQFPHSYIRSI